VHGNGREQNSKRNGTADQNARIWHGGWAFLACHSVPRVPQHVSREVTHAARNVRNGSRADISLMSALGGKRTFPGLLFPMIRLPHLALLVLSACASVSSGRAEGNELPYGCRDLVVIGRLAQLNEAPVPSDHPLRVSQRQFRFQIKRVIKGVESRTSVLAEGVSHSRPREDVDFLMVLEPRPDGTYSKRTGALWNVSPRPALVEPCL
jgi:hypothetical protein